jgi:predicted aspartyl protease
MKSTRRLAILSSLLFLAARGDDVRFGAGRSALGIPFDGSNRHITFQAKVNDRDGVWLVLDTGAGGSVIDAKLAASLGLVAEGVHHALGAGGPEEGSTVHGVNVELPGFELRDQTMSTLPLGSLAAQAGRPLDGVLGYPVFERCVVEIDYAKQCVNLFDADDYKYKGSGVSLPLTFKDNLPYVKAKVVLSDGRSISGKFVIDTGASTSLILTTSTTKREGVESSLGKTMTVQARGVGGAKTIVMGRIARLQLGEFTLAEPITALQPPGPGIVSAEGTVGNIGAGILSRFKVILDYRRRRMILEPGPDVAQPFEADMSGLGLVSLPPEWKRVSVARVLDGSPATEAGIKPGDEVESVNGTPAAAIGLSVLREQLKVDGVGMRIGILRGDEHIVVDLKTRRMI